MKTIDSCENLSRAGFNNVYLNRKPVIHRGEIKNSKSFTCWSPDYLKSMVGSRRVVVKYSKKGIYNFNVKGQVQEVEVPFDEAIGYFTAGNSESKTYYLQQTSLAKCFPELLGDLENPALNLDTDFQEEINLWMGGAGCVSPLHFDRMNNFLVQVRGRKEITFFAPGDSGYLYASTQPGGTHLSEIDLENVDDERFPLFKKATPFHCTLEAGDVLYIPPLWWHHVRSLDMSISVNYWWNRFDVAEGLGLESLSVQDLCNLIRTFVDRGLDINTRDPEGEPMLLKAIQKGYTNVAEAFLRLGANPDATSVKYGPGLTALALAEANGDTASVNLLLAFGAEDFAEKSFGSGAV